MQSQAGKQAKERYVYKKYFSKLMRLTNFFNKFLSNPKKIIFKTVEAARKFNVNVVDCSSVLGSHVLVVLFVCVFFVIPFFALFLCFFYLILFLVS